MPGKWAGRCKCKHVPWPVATGNKRWGCWAVVFLTYSVSKILRLVGFKALGHIEDPMIVKKAPLYLLTRVLWDVFNLRPARKILGFWRLLSEPSPLLSLKKR